MMNYAFVIDLYHMNKVELKEDCLLVYVEGGAYLEEIDKILQPHNLGVTIGTYPQTGVGGLVLGGGVGFLARMYGFSVDNLVEVEVVLASGDVVIANDLQNTELIWGLRGGSGNFGIVTKFTFRVHKLPTYCICGSVVSLTPTLSSAVDVASNLDKLVSNLPENMSVMVVAEGGSNVSPSLWTYFGEENSPVKVPILQQASNLGGNTIKLSSYHNDVQRITTPIVLHGYLYHTVIQFGELDVELPQEFWEKLLAFTRAMLHESLLKALVVSLTMGGKLATNDPDGTTTCIARSLRKARYFGVIEVYWKPEFGEKGKEEARKWARTVVEIIQPFCNEVLRYAAPDVAVGIAGLKDQAGYGQDKYPKLRALKRKYDPTNLFNNNVNILPAD
jgi:hypothetical protein